MYIVIWYDEIGTAHAKIFGSLIDANEYFTNGALIFVFNGGDSIELIRQDKNR